MSLLKRSAVVAAAAGLLTLAIAGPASAHVTVNPSTATAGGYTKVTFRVPNESDSASTTTLEVNLPADQPIASVSVKPIPGWTAVAVKSKLATPIKSHDTEITEAVSKITWTATKGSEIKPGEFQEFDVSMGALPESGQLVFKALQTYSDGNVVRWIDEPTTDGSEPDSPAPVLKIVPAAAAASAAPAAGAAAPAAPAAPAAEASDDSSSGSGLGLAGLIAGLIALVLAGLAYAKASRKPEPAAAVSEKPTAS
ncbi:YcnI family protein [Actinoplanes sp. HUAS TT8]|uniref:YcnI family protein n=1 Tax=Actinoplanes sp. HUAS TT8 TaxID=3447453 RepID=UPI003F51EC1C